MTPSPPSSLGVQTTGQAAFAIFFVFASAPLHRQCLRYLSIYFITVLGNIMEHIVYVGRADRTELVSCSLPA